MVVKLVCSQNGFNTKEIDMSFWDSLVNEINQHFKSILEWLFYIAVFSIISNLAFDGDDTSFAMMIASYAMLISIINRRKVSKGEVV
jgi:hypothetical protein